MKLHEKQIKFALMLGRLLIYASIAKIPVKIVELYRTPKRQLVLVKKGFSKTLNSKHLCGLAIDLAIIKEGRYITDIGEYEPLGAFWEGIGGVWGGRWKIKDGVHFELSEKESS